MISKNRQAEIENITSKVARCCKVGKPGTKEDAEAIREAWHAIVDFRKTATDEEKSLIDARTKSEVIAMAYDGAVFLGLIDEEEGY